MFTERFLVMGAKLTIKEAKSECYGIQLSSALCTKLIMQKCEQTSQTAFLPSLYVRVVYECFYRSLSDVKPEPFLAHHYLTRNQPTFLL